MHTALIITLALLLFFAIVLAFTNRRQSVITYNDCDEEVTRTTTTTTYAGHEAYQAVGQLSRRFENNQPYVIDPHDGDKVFVNTKDDMYEDGAGRVWKLV